MNDNVRTPLHLWIVAALATVWNAFGAFDYLMTQTRNEAYLAVLLLARVVTRLGSLSDITPEVIEGLYAADFDHLQRLYERLNTDGEAVGAVTCPHCAETFEVDLTEIEDGRLGK